MFIFVYYGGLASSGQLVIPGELKVVLVVLWLPLVLLGCLLILFPDMYISVLSIIELVIS